MQGGVAKRRRGGGMQLVPRHVRWAVRGRQEGGKREIERWEEEGDMCGKRRDRRMGK